MRNAAALLLAGCATAAFAPLAAAQPGTRNAIVYGARAVGETNWHFGTLTLQSGDTNPLTFEVGVFFFRAQGHAFRGAVYKTYIDGVGTVGGDSASPFPGDNRQGVFNNGAQTQAVFTNRNVSIPGSGFRISSPSDVTDGSAAGGISVKQRGPISGPAIETTDGNFGYRFNVTLARTPAPRDVLVHTPLSRINSFSVYNQDGSNTSSELKTTTTSDPITIHASWIPAPATLALLGLGGLFAGRRRRSAPESLNGGR